MPTSTLELPREMVDAARRYAASEHRTVTDLFAELMKSRYGFTMKLVVAMPVDGRKRAVRLKRVRISPKVSALRGAFALPQGLDYESARDAALREKYGLA